MLLILCLRKLEGQKRLIFLSVACDRLKIDVLRPTIYPLGISQLSTT